MSVSDPGTAFGRVFHPEADPTPDGRARAARHIGLPGLPRRRRAGMIALAVALMGGAILGFAYMFQSADHRVPVVMATAEVPAGAVINSNDLGTAQVAAGPGPQLIPAGQLSQVAGHVAATALHPGMLLVPSELTTSQPPGPGQVLVPVPVRPAILPASGLTPGDKVMVVATPGTAGQAGSSGSSPPSLVHQVSGVVEAVNTVPNQDGFDVVDLIVPAQEGTAVAQQASTGQIALLVTSRNP